MVCKQTLLALLCQVRIAVWVTIEMNQLEGDLEVQTCGACIMTASSHIFWALAAHAMRERKQRATRNPSTSFNHLIPFILSQAAKNYHFWKGCSLLVECLPPEGSFPCPRWKSPQCSNGEVGNAPAWTPHENCMNWVLLNSLHLLTAECSICLCKREGLLSICLKGKSSHFN